MHIYISHYIMQFSICKHTHTHTHTHIYMYVCMYDKITIYYSLVSFYFFYKITTLCLFHGKTFYKDSFPHFPIFGSIKNNNNNNKEI